MAKKKKNAQKNVAEPIANELQNEVSVPKFEIGVKGDEFDLKYRQAAAKASNDADRLLGSLGRESKADKYNFLGFSIPAIIIVFIALSFILVSRGDIEELINVEPAAESVLNGSYTQNLNLIYESTVPFGENIKSIGMALGFLPKSEIPEKDPNEPDQSIDSPDESKDPSGETIVTTAATQNTEPTSVSAAPTTVSSEEATTEKEVYNTFVMYANATLNIRLGPSTNDAILGYYSKNDPVDVIEIGSDGWAAVLYNDIKAYVFADYLSEKPAVTTKKPRHTQAETTEEEFAATTLLTDEYIPDSTQDGILPDNSEVTSDDAQGDIQLSDSDSQEEAQPQITFDMPEITQPSSAPPAVFTMPE